MSASIENHQFCGHPKGCQNPAISNVTIQTERIFIVRNLCKKHLAITQQREGRITERNIVPTSSTLPEGFQIPFSYQKKS